MDWGRYFPEPWLANHGGISSPLSNGKPGLIEICRSSQRDFPRMPQIKQSNFINPFKKDASQFLTGKSRKSLFARLLPFYWTALVPYCLRRPRNLPPLFSAGAHSVTPWFGVIILSNLFAMVILSLSAQLGNATVEKLARTLPLNPHNVGCLGKCG